jgi:hypothetical protein
MWYSGLAGLTEFQTFNFQGRFLQVGSHKSRIFIYLFIYLLGLFCVSFLIIIINDELVNKLVNGGK